MVGSDLLQHKEIYGRKDLDHNYIDVLMGIEFEALNIKVHYNPENPTGLKFFSHNEVAWILEEDTFDTHDPFHKNDLECKSVGGYTLDGINRIADEMGVVLKMVVRNCHSRGDSAIFVSSDIERPLRGQENDAFVTRKANESILHVLLTNGEKSLEETLQSIKINPQITYQIELKHLEKLFRRCFYLGRKSMRDFMECMNLMDTLGNPSSPAPLEEPQAVSSSQKDYGVGDGLAGRRLLRDLIERSRTQKDQQETEFERIEKKQSYDRTLIEQEEVKMRLIEIRRLTKQILSTVVMPVYHSTKSESLKGFILLFSFYWYNMFNDDQSVGGEAGLKQYAAIMSRVPISQLYWHCLSPADRNSFQQIFAPIINKLGDRFFLRQYTREIPSKPGHTERVIQRYELNNSFNVYNGASQLNECNALIPLTLKEWYYSIVSENRDEKHQIKPDLLSPAPGLLPIDGIPYAMGAMSIGGVKLPIFEVRSYSSTSHGNIDKVVNLVHNESKWFSESMG